MQPLTNITSLKRTIKPPSSPIKKKKSKTVAVAKNVKTTPKPSRKVYQAEKNLAPSVTYSTEKLSIRLEEHGNLRIQLFYLTSLALYKKAVRTGKPPSDVKVSIPGARIQVGQGNRENHAAHANASANVVDNLKDLYKEQINQDGLSPLKRALLSKAKNVPDWVLDLIDKNHEDKNFVSSLLDEYWAESSLIIGTKLEFTLNATDKLPSKVNLGCDLSLEKAIRPYMEKLYTQLMKGEINPDEATSLFQERTVEHFEKRIEELKEKKASLRSSASKVDQLKDCKNQLFFHNHELIGSKASNYLHMKKEFEQETDDIERPIDVDKTYNLFV